MNKEPIRFTLKTKDKRVYIVMASCAEYEDSESTRIAANQMLTQFDVEIIQKGLDAKATASISIMPYKKFPDHQAVFDHNDYTPTDKTDIWLRAFYNIEDEPKKIYPFYGQIIFDGMKVFFQEDPKSAANEKITFALSENPDSLLDTSVINNTNIN